MLGICWVSINTICWWLEVYGVVGSIPYYIYIAMMRTHIGARIYYRFAIEKKLFVYDSGQRDGTMDYSINKLHSGVRATIFGASGTSSCIQEILVDPLLQSSVSQAAVRLCLWVSITTSDTLSKSESWGRQVPLVVLNRCRPNLDWLQHEL